MSYIEPEYEYDLKCEQLAMQIETFILDRIICALERLNINLESLTTQDQKPPDDIEPF